MKGRSGWKKRILAFALSAAIGITAAPFAGIGTQDAYAAEMKGISQNHWAWASMQKMYEQGILSGDASGNMHPDRAVTRAEFISMLNRAFNYTQYGGEELPFKDMTGEEWYATHIRVAYSQGYFSGVAADRAGATEAITREAAAAMICRNLKVESKTLQLTQFTDGTKISQWSRGSVGAAVDKGYLKGYEDGTFRPKNYISRAEAATMLANALGTILSQGGTYSGVFEGNVTLSASNVTLKDAVISGDLYITEGVGTGYVDLENVTVLGEVIVCGGGEGRWGGNSVEMKHCSIQKLTVDGSDDRAVSLYATGDTTIAETNIKSSTYLQNHPDTVPGFDNVKVFGPEETTLYLSGNFKKVDLINPKNHVVVGKGEVEQLTVDEDAKEGGVQIDRGALVKTLNVDGQAAVTGMGDIESLVVTANGATIEQLPDQIEIRPGATAEIDGKEMTSYDAAESSDAPRILAGYPKAKEITSAKANVLFSTNKPGTIYWALTYDDAKSLSQEDIMKPTSVERIKQSGTISAAESAKELTAALANLESDAKFTVSAVLLDDRNNVSRVKEVSFRTADSTQPGFVSGYPKTVPISSHRFDIEAMPLKDGTIYWAVYPKGAAQPTAYQLRSGEAKGAIISGKHTDCERNVEYIMAAEHDKLVEDVSYDVYVMANDGEKDSAIIKLTGVTKDTTPPEFLEGTPAQAKNDVSSVDVTVGSNEDGKVYYVVVDWDEIFPVPVVVDGKLVKPTLDSEQAKQQVYAGNNMKRTGSANVTADDLINVKLNGLEEETPYRVYMLLEDKSGNLSDEVRMAEIKTRDVTPPTAYVTCDNPIDGKMPVSEPIKIVFSEIVWNALSAENGGEEPNAENLKKYGKDIIKLYDLTLNQEEEVEIDFSKVQNETGEKGATILVFPKEAFPRADGTFGLNSGSRFQFELNNIMDTSGNYMKKDTRLDIFETVPPLVVLAETLAKRDDMDYTFSVVPQSQQTADYILFDMLLTADQDITIELYQRTDPLGGWTQLKNKTGSGTFALGKNRLTSLHALLGSATGVDAFEKFNTMETYREYGVKVTSIAGDQLKEGWHTTVSIDVTCVAGQSAMLTKVLNGTAQVTDEGISRINYSTQNPKDTTKFVLEMPFMDSIVPEFILDTPKVDNTGITDPSNYRVTDTLIRPELVTNRKATMYYLIAPKGKITFEDIQDLAPHIQSGLYQGVEGAFVGSLEIPTGNSTYNPILPQKGDLQPETEYEFFAVLKGVPEQLSEVYYRAFKTQKISPPLLKAKVSALGETSAEIRISSDKSALVDWIVLTVDQAKQFKDMDPTMAATRIRNKMEDLATRPITSGGGVTQYGNAETGYEYYMDVTVDGIQRQLYYVLVGVGKMALSDGNTVGGDSQILFSEEFTARDLTPPTITFGTSFHAQDLTDKSLEDNGGYKGTLTITSTEGLYYIPGEKMDPIPVDDAALDEMVTRMSLGPVKFEKLGWDGQKIFDKDGVDTGKKAMYICYLGFTNANEGAQVLLGLDFCDVNGNSVGNIILTFRDMEGKNTDQFSNTLIQRQRSYWEESYSKS